MRIPKKPFPSYKWRWADFTPSENLNHPLFITGVIRTLYQYQGSNFNDSALDSALNILQNSNNKLLNTDVTLTSTSEGRNKFRNAGRYWRALGLLKKNRNVSLTPFGSRVATGEITEEEFALTTISELTLPNPYIESATTLETWRQAGIQIKPLRLILTILLDLYKQYGTEQAYLTAYELRWLIIPLAGDKGTSTEYIDTIISYRNDQLDAGTFPDCATAANDSRMIREFLLFFANYGFCDITKGEKPAKGRYVQELDHFCLQPDSIEELSALLFYTPSIRNPEIIVEAIRRNPAIFGSERVRKQSTRLERDQQAAFRKAILEKSNSTCLITGEQIPLVLEAAHIIPVEFQGADIVENGLCLRRDIHRLFDKKHIRISETGTVHYSGLTKQSVSYTQLPDQIKLPDYISPEALKWRWQTY